eukprot:1622493-Pleurochrysis_carterae.AAC.1
MELKQREISSSLFAEERSNGETMRMPMTERHISSSSPPEAFAAVCEAFSTCRNQFHMFYYLRDAAFA